MSPKRTKQQAGIGKNKIKIKFHFTVFSIVSAKNQVEHPKLPNRR